MDHSALLRSAAAGDESAVRHLAAFAAATGADDEALDWVHKLRSSLTTEQQIVDCLTEFAPRRGHLGRQSRPQVGPSGKPIWLPHIVRWLRRAAQGGQLWAIVRLGSDRGLVDRQGSPTLPIPSDSASLDASELIPISESKRWLEVAATLGHRHSSFLLASESQNSPFLAERWYRRVWDQVDNEMLAGSAGYDGVSVQEFRAAAHQLALLTARRGSPAARGWFIRCTSTAPWYEGETDANRSAAILDYYRWAVDVGDHQLAENLLVGLTSEGFTHMRISVVALEEGSYESYGDDWRDTDANVRVWHEATVELARVRASSREKVEANRLLRFASETSTQAGSRQLGADDVAATLTTGSSVLTLLTQTLQSSLQGQLAAQIAGFQAGAVPDSEESSSRASYGLLDWLVREYLPEWLDAGEAYGLASWLREDLPPIVDVASAYEAKAPLISAGLPSWLREDLLRFEEMPPIVDLASACEAFSAPLIDDASQSGDRSYPTCLPPDGARGFDVFTSSWEDVRLGSISAGAFRSVMRAVGGDVATDLAEGAGMPGADIPSSRRFLSSTNLWLAMWAATVDDQTAETVARSSRGGREPWMDLWDHPWMGLWDLASRMAWESAQVASHNILVQARAEADIFDPGMVLESKFAPTRAALQLSVFEAYRRIALNAPKCPDLPRA